MFCCARCIESKLVVFQVLMLWERYIFFFNIIIFFHRMHHFEILFTLKYLKLCVAVDHNSQSTFTYQRYTHRRVHVILLKRVCAETSVLSFIHKSTHFNKQTCQKCYDNSANINCRLMPRCVWRSKVLEKGHTKLQSSPTAFASIEPCFVCAYTFYAFQRRSLRHFYQSAIFYDIIRVVNFFFGILFCPRHLF